MQALRQVEKFKVYRDNTNDDKTDEVGPLYEGFYGINFHAATYNESFKGIQTKIGGWSAGCQVSNNKQKYLEVIELVKNQKRVTYALLKEWN
jgi:hypothetical protein